MGKSKYEYQGSVHHFKKKKPDNNGWAWVIGIAVFLIILAAA